MFAMVKWPFASVIAYLMILPEESRANTPTLSSGTSVKEAVEGSSRFTAMAFTTMFPNNVQLVPEFDEAIFSMCMFTPFNCWLAASDTSVASGFQFTTVHDCDVL